MSETTLPPPYEDDEDRFWRYGYTHKGGRPYAGKTALRYPTPKKLWEAACNYFEFVADNPLKEEKIFHNSGEIVRATISKRRAMSQRGLRIFLGVSEQTWYRYVNNPDFGEVTQAIRDVIYTYKFEGAAADLLNASFIARELGLAERQEHSGPNGGPIETVMHDAEEFTAKMAKLAERSAE